MTESVRVQDAVAIVLPSLDPDRKFETVVNGLLENGFQHIVIVDDGSDSAHQAPFEYAARFSECVVLRHGVNKGKGRAPQNSISICSDSLPAIKGVVTIDGDGQHLIPDIIACGEKMLSLPDTVVLGCRDFDQPNVPPRSVAGNKTTNRFFRILFGITISDTQTGLRAIPREFLEEFCRIDGERFEYETNMLLQMKHKGMRWVEQKIETVYDSEDYSSHYNAVKDSLRIARVMLRYKLGVK